MGQAIAEHWRTSAHRLVDQLDRSGSARLEFRTQDRLWDAGGGRAVPPSMRCTRTTTPGDGARQVAKDLVQAGQIVETRIGRAEAYIAAEFVGG
jgi:hypothetical protein